MVLSAAGANKVNNRYSYNIILTITDTKSSARDNQNLSKPLSNRFDIPVCLNESETNEFRYFPKSNFVGFNKLFVLVYPNQNADSRRFKTWKCYLLKDKIKNNNIIDGISFSNQPIVSDKKWYKEIRKLTARQGEN